MSQTNQSVEQCHHLNATHDGNLCLCCALTQITDVGLSGGHIMSVNDLPGWETYLSDTIIYTQKRYAFKVVDI